ncbi:MAG: hypothetical protein JWM11_433 [Planctomycetaceae bacterium]|nr:hypothetical protein [Planctomycetaceae bacterium]
MSSLHVLFFSAVIGNFAAPLFPRAYGYDRYEEKDDDEEEDEKDNEDGDERSLAIYHQNCEHLKKFEALLAWQSELRP